MIQDQILLKQKENYSPKESKNTNHLENLETIDTTKLLHKIYVLILLDETNYEFDGNGQTENKNAFSWGDLVEKVKIIHMPIKSHKIKFLNLYQIIILCATDGINC